MRGGAQSHLLQAEDGAFYIVKFRNNPQHRRILVNELVCSVLLRYLQIAAPRFSLIEITPEFLDQNPQVHFELGSRAVPVEPGIHFGSRHPGDPDKLAVYDFMPDALLGQISNIADFQGILAFDKWVSNADSRQCVFFRAQLKEWTRPGPAPPPRQKLGFVALMIDHGFAFNGPQWDFPESPVQGLYLRRTVYERVRSLDDFQPWLDQIVHFPEEVIDDAWKQVPRAWIDGDEDALEQTLELLLGRRQRLPDLIGDCRKARLSPFPNWT